MAGGGICSWEKLLEGSENITDCCDAAKCRLLYCGLNSGLIYASQVSCPGLRSSQGRSISGWDEWMDDPSQDGRSRVAFFFFVCFCFGGPYWAVLRSTLGSELTARVDAESHRAPLIMQVAKGVYLTSQDPSLIQPGEF